ncbi:hypothetical protein [Archaeoglobus profundus]|uniref:Uncharacterized protein n=1 Tax=Archaeoglobus profundus (strain DSM 5631 / JCM 9629 / NBRC 100127 / Av18) TaxID=572546 RepID=D2RE85_ARCPA|nr:hypothetical protein [Archaeoglobus profundus]ADB58429.1 hypothetical protein Arcpr_1380 [Archaeoglobus profundus DSM 5631]
MDIIKTVFKLAEGGDRILMLFPDMYSFLGIARWISENYGDLFWILWTDAAVERINHFGKKYGFPISGDAIALFTTKKCEYINVVDHLNTQSDVSAFMRALNVDKKIVISFGMDFLKIYGYDVNKAIEALIGFSGDNLFITTLFTRELADKLQPFHDFYVEISESKDTYISYRMYKASLKFSIKGGVAVISNTFVLDRRVGYDEGF